MKYHWHLTGLFLGMSVGLSFWLAYEIGVVSYPGAIAADEPKTSSLNSDRIKELDDRELELREKERGLKDKETILKDQLTRYEKLILELRQKLSAKEEELKSKVQSKEEELKRKLYEKEEEMKRRIAEKDRELKKKGFEMESLKDRRADAYRIMYEKMEAKKAARILNDLDLSLAGQILGDMKQQQAAEILGQMNPEKARQVTELNLGKRQVASVPEGKKDSHSVNAVPESSPISEIKP